MVKQKQKLFLSRQSVLGYVVGGGVYFWSAWLIITIGEPYIGLWWANIIGNTVGVVMNFLVQRYKAFPGKNILNSGWKFVLLTLVNFIISYFVLKFLVDKGIKLWLAQFIAAGFFTVWNYVWYRLWVFRDGE